MLKEDKVANKRLLVMVKMMMTVMMICWSKSP